MARCRGLRADRPRRRCGAGWSIENGGFLPRFASIGMSFSAHSRRLRASRGPTRATGRSPSGRATGRRPRARSAPGRFPCRSRRGRRRRPRARRPLDQALGDQRAGDRRAEQVLALVDGVGPEHGEDEVARELLAQVLDEDLSSAPPSIALTRAGSSSSPWPRSTVKVITSAS